MNRVVVSEGFHRQCPACGVPVAGSTMEFKKTPSGFALLLEDCGHVVTLEMLRDAWGIDIPDPDTTRVAYPTRER